MSEKTFKVVGVSTHNGETKVKFANDLKSRERVLSKEGHTNIEFVTLPKAMTKDQATAYLQSGAVEFNGNPNAADALDQLTGGLEVKVGENVKFDVETDAQVIDRTRQRFNILDDMTKAVKAGTIRAMIVSGPPGVGKSFGVENVLTKDDLFNTMANRAPKYEVVKGAMSAIGLYKKLWEMSDEKCVLVFDDCDGVLLDDLSLNILKAALDTSRKRTIAWNTDSRLLRSEGIPDKFEFKGAAIFITNIKFENVRSKKLKDHLAALESRCHYIDLKMDTEREKMLRIKQIIVDGMLKDYKFSVEDKETIINFIDANKKKLRELSLRTVLKIADLYKSFPDNWDNMAKVTVMKN